MFLMTFSSLMHKAWLPLFKMDILQHFTNAVLFCSSCSQALDQEELSLSTPAWCKIFSRSPPLSLNRKSCKSITNMRNRWRQSMDTRNHLQWFCSGCNAIQRDIFLAFKISWSTLNRVIISKNSKPRFHKLFLKKRATLPACVQIKQTGILEMHSRHEFSKLIIEMYYRNVLSKCFSILIINQYYTSAQDQSIC
jgi:hypothetical protein